MLTRPKTRTTLALAASALLLSACGASDGEDTHADHSSTSASPSATAEASASASSGSPASPSAGTTVAIEIAGKKISPQAKRVTLRRDELVAVKITSDRSGELHVHSTPEQEISFGSGTTTKQLRFATPGVLEVEEHDSDTLLVQFEVR